MIKSYFIRNRWKRLRLKVWKNRMNKQLHRLSLLLRWKGQIELHVSWGPFYSGFVIMHRRAPKAKIVIQLPYDGFLTADERDILSRYSISRRDLPYFILFHEFSHLSDTVPLTQTSDLKEWKYLFRRKQWMAAKNKRTELDYRNLSFERKADAFAYQTITNMDKPAG